MNLLNAGRVHILVGHAHLFVREAKADEPEAVGFGWREAMKTTIFS
jgi:hypothetical protein